MYFIITLTPSYMLKLGSINYQRVLVAFSHLAGDTIIYTTCTYIHSYIYSYIAHRFLFVMILLFLYVCLTFQCRFAFPSTLQLDLFITFMHFLHGQLPCALLIAYDVAYQGCASFYVTFIYILILTFEINLFFFNIFVCCCRKCVCVGVVGDKHSSWLKQKLRIFMHLSYAIKLS